MLRLALALLLGLSGVAHAQYNVPSQVTGSSVEIARGDAGVAKAPPARGWELGTSLDFVTRDGGALGGGLKFTDLVLLRAHGLVVLGERTELFGGVDLLPKQPSTTDELLWQSALVGLRQTWSKSLSGYARAQGGPAVARDGYWVMGEAAAQARVTLAEKVLYWESTLGGTYTQLFPDRGSKALWQTEALAQTGVAVRDDRGVFAAWLNFGFHFPVVARPRPSAPDPATDRALDPQTRVDVSLGMRIGVNRGLDLFIEAAILDRGERDQPRTTLPILAGGTDQRRLLFGFNRRFGARRR
ncbi:MAG: hypothetical protein R3B48_00100 [Kofleriaceae bacterium]